MWSPPTGGSQQGRQARPRGPHVKGKYDWRLRRQHGEHATNAIPTSNAGSAPDSLPPDLLAKRGTSSADAGHERRGSSCADSASTLLHPACRGTPSSVTSNTPMTDGWPTFMSWPGDEAGTVPPQRTTSVDSSFDDEQLRCVHAAYRVSFPGDKRIRERPYRVAIGDVTFLLVERTVSGHSDAVYQRNKKIWEHVPRGQARVFVTVPVTPSSSVTSTPTMGYPPGSVAGERPASSSAHRRSRSPEGSSTGSFGTSRILVAKLDGLRKFAHWGDSCANVYNVNKEVPVTAVALEKADGESCHVAAFIHDGVRYWVVGLRDRHLIVRLQVPDEDVAAYKEDSSFTTAPATGSAATADTAAARRCTRAAMEAARGWRCLLLDMQPGQLEALHDHVADRQWTLCFDAVVAGCEHYVDYALRVTDDCDSKEEAPYAGTAHGEEGGDCVDDEDSGTTTMYGKKVTLLFYAVTLSEPSDRGLCVPVEEAMQFFRAYDLPTVDMSESLEVNSPEYSAHRAAISAKLNSAGAVFYGVNEQGMVVRLWKCRCHSYELERAAQEFIVTHRLHGHFFETKFQKKLGGLPKETRAAGLTWERERLPFLVAFSQWLSTTRQLTPSTDLAALQELRGHWVSAQNTFRKLQEAGYAEEMRDTGDVLTGIGVNTEDCEAAQDEDSEEQCVAPEVILLAGPQGCGKSTLARALFVILEEVGCTPRWINQDEVSNRRAYIAAIERAVCSRSCTHIILDKMNLDKAGRDADYGDLGLHVIEVVAWVHPQGAEALVDVCFNRVKQRGAGHRTFRAVDDAGDHVEAASAPPSPPLPSATPSPPSMRAQSSVPSATVASDVQLRRVRGILQDCAARYEEPQRDASLVEVEVTLNCNATLQRVWRKLQERSMYDLPDLQTLNAEDAFDVALGYERLMSTFPHRISAAVLDVVDAAELRTLVARAGAEGTGKKSLESVHIVLHNFSEDPSPAALVRYADKLGKTVTLEAVAVVSDSKATLLQMRSLGGKRVEDGGPPCARRQQHRALSPPADRSRGTHGDAAGCAASSVAEKVGGCDGGGANVNEGGVQQDSKEHSYMAVVARAKKTGTRYCSDLLQRAMDPAATDPCVQYVTLPRGATVDFVYHFISGS